MKLSFEKLRAANVERGAQWDGKPASLDDLSFRAMELGGETGEALNVAKKLVRKLSGRVGGLTLEEARPMLAEELADVVICADRVAEVLAIDLAPAIIAKFNKTSRKHGLVEILPTPEEIDEMPRDEVRAFLESQGVDLEAFDRDMITAKAALEAKANAEADRQDQDDQSRAAWRDNNPGISVIR